MATWCPALSRLTESYEALLFTGERRHQFVLAMLVN